MSEDILFNKYQIIKTLGRGGMAEVFLVRNIKLDHYVAVKKIHKRKAKGIDFFSEPHLLKSLEHSAIPRILDIEEDDTYFYIIEEYIEGMSLKAYYKRNYPLNEITIINFADQMCEILHYLHSHQPYSIIFQDLKPDNLIVTSSQQLKLVDFGIAQDAKTLENNREPLGTLGFASPEQYGTDPIDERTDIYSLGMTLYYLATGLEPAFVGEELPVVNGYSKPLVEVIKKATKSIPQERYTSIDLLRKDLNQLQENNKMENKLTLSKPMIITLAGTQSRIGVTHQTIALGHYLQSKGYRVLIRENHPSEDFLAIQAMYPHINCETFTFSIKGLVFMPYNEEVAMVDLFKEGYHFILLDQGVFDEVSQDIFRQSDIKIIIAGGKEWEIEYLEGILEVLREDKSIQYIFNYVDQSLYRELIKNMGKCSCYKAPYHPNPFNLTELALVVYKEMTKGFITNQNKGKELLKKLFRRQS